MNTIFIQNFGPIKEVKLDLDKKFQILIGEQASGKSTISKVVYFCQKIRDYTLDFLLDSRPFSEYHKNELFNGYLKYLQRQFMGCFGTTKHMDQFSIVYLFHRRRISIKLNENGYIRYQFDDELKKGITKLLYDAAGIFLNNGKEKGYLSLIDRLTAMEMMKRQFEQNLKELFCNSSEIIYIPAGRSLLATLSEQLQDIPISGLDLTMQEFIRLILRTRNKFGNKMPEMVKDYTNTVKGQINNASVERAYDIIREILRADYASESDGEKIYFDEQHWVKLMYGSSGQQEVLWILMLSFITILENKGSFFVIEEPEAHLFPTAQKDIIDLISLMLNSTNSKAIITTHSPYILTSANVLLYSDKVERGYKGKTKPIIPKNMRISYQNFAAYKVERNDMDKKVLTSILDAESHMIQVDYIDRVSKITNEELSGLLDMELEDGM